MNLYDLISINSNQAVIFHLGPTSETTPSKLCVDRINIDDEGNITKLNNITIESNYFSYRLSSKNNSSVLLNDNKILIAYAYKVNSASAGYTYACRILTLNNNGITIGSKYTVASTLQDCIDAAPALTKIDNTNILCSWSSVGTGKVRLQARMLYMSSSNTLKISESIRDIINDM